VITTLATNKNPWKNTGMQALAGGEGR
jgi:hypothetical protein